ncbi:heme-binding domain-containing protein [Serratia microhaemolytica]|uniref:heme-binding domain-containing protein n=1 Tax=Serratia microhaemolytica TaxID=2675110 RepID=UPI001F0C216A|nr:heme-binding domain-containing protein [Serratia microhaemolytica]
MIKKIILGFSTIAVLGYLGTVGYVYHYDQQRLPAVANNRIDTLLTQYGCDYCHTRSAQLPFYTQLPLVDQFIEHDITQGMRHFDLAATRTALQNDQPVPEVDLAKLEAVLQNNEMPPKLYKVMHWAANISEADRAVLMKWIQQQRAENYAHSETPIHLRTAALRPVPESLSTDARKVALGERLYHDPRLSKDNTLSCASCHQLDAGGDDGRIASIGINNQRGLINAPTVFNAVFNNTQFWDGRSANL